MAVEQEQKTASAEQEQVEVKATKSEQVQSEQAKSNEPNKNEIAGLNRKVSELEKLLSKYESERKEAERAKMTEQEKLEQERLDLKADKEAVKKERVGLKIIKELANAGLPSDFAKRIIGETDNEIASDVKSLKDYLNEKAHELSESEIAKRLKGEPPKGGSTETKGALQLQYDEAKASKNIAGQLNIIRKARASGEKITE